MRWFVCGGDGGEGGGGRKALTMIACPMLSLTGVWASWVGRWAGRSGVGAQVLLGSRALVCKGREPGHPLCAARSSRQATLSTQLGSSCSQHEFGQLALLPPAPHP